MRLIYFRKMLNEFPLYFFPHVPVPNVAHALEKFTITGSKRQHSLCLARPQNRPHQWRWLWWESQMFILFNMLFKLNTCETSRLDKQKKKRFRHGFLKKQPPFHLPPTSVHSDRIILDADRWLNEKCYFSSVEELRELSPYDVYQGLKLRCMRRRTLSIMRFGRTSVKDCAESCKDSPVIDDIVSQHLNAIVPAMEDWQQIVHIGLG